ncbi:MAG: DUF1540 domain-containing protein [Syntrophomonadaceae bacterium]|nr:DUF1540 domain-containing protein [Syntrophomonadaceae bacterium]
MHVGRKQSIGCTVESCVHYHSGDYCSLSAIVVQPCTNCSNGSPEDESMCSNYRHR